MAAAESPDVAPGRRLSEIEATARRRLIARSVGSSAAWVVAIVAAYYLAPWDGGNARAVAIRIAAALVVLVVGTALAVPFVLRSEYPVLGAVQALSFVVALAIVSFASIYLFVSSNQALAFTEPLGRTDALYFSMTTATTIGYGDISPRTEAARVVVMIQMVTNVAVIGAAARLLAHTVRQRLDDR